MEMPIANGFNFLKGGIKKHPTKNFKLEYLIRIDAVCVTVFDYEMKNVYLVNQYRAGSDSNMLEIVAGLIDEGEAPLHAAYRELREETGYDKDSIESFLEMKDALYVSPGYSTEKIYFYGARLKKDAKPLEQKLDEGEDIEVVKLSVEEALKISTDMKTTLGISYFLNKKDEF